MDENKVYVESINSEPLLDKKINGKSRMVKMKIGDYLKITSITSNEYQRNIQSPTFYKKLRKDLLDDTVMPPISVVYPEKDIDLSNGLLIDKKFIILDGLQRTNSIMECIKTLEQHKSEGIIKDVETFENKEIYVEIWEELELKYILYKMVVLNTGQKKMDYEHQLDILSESVETILNEHNVKYITRKEELDKRSKDNDTFKLSAITTGLVSFISGKPSSGKKNAAEFLFERFNLSMEIDEEDVVLNLINNDETYKILTWVLTEFNERLNFCYGSEENPLRKYDVFLSSMMGSMGEVFTKNPEQFKNKFEDFKDLVNQQDDPLQIKAFEASYNAFKTGIGQKRRRFIYETFKLFFKMSSSDRLEWEQIKDEIE